MENFDIKRAACLLQQKFPSLTKNIIVSYEDDDKVDEKVSLDNIAKLLLNETCTVTLAEIFSPLLLDLLIRCKVYSHGKIDRHEDLCAALGKLIWLYPNVAGFTYDYFSDNTKSMFVRYENLPDSDTDNDSSPSKKIEMTKDKKRKSFLLVAALQFLVFDVEYFRNIWNWSVLIRFLDKGDDIGWLSHYCLAIVSDMNRDQLNIILAENYLETENRVFRSRHGDLLKHISRCNILNEKKFLQGSQKPKNGSKITPDFVKEVINVEGVLLPMQPNSANTIESEQLVIVESIRGILLQLSMAVASKTPVLLQGSVGCGKTSLIEHLAEVTNRKNPQHLLRVQLCDQIDSKLLLGSYCCTEVPGEFVWQPGILTEAVVNGHWLIMEDIDSAPMDVISILAPILESQSLVLPGHANPIRVHPMFQLFATQRIISGHQYSYLEYKSNADHLNKFWRKITIPDFSFQELKDIICMKWPNLLTFSTKILTIYNDYAGHLIESESVPPAYLQHGRLISVRDLFKFCKRISKGFTSQQTEAGIEILFQHALDCFCNSLPSMADREEMAALTGERFGLSVAKASWLSSGVKPDIDQFENYVQAGRAKLDIKEIHAPLVSKFSHISFAHTRQAVSLLEKIAVAVNGREPVLLVGETGTGKTAVVQYLAKITNNKLCVINMSQQSDSIDLIGGFKPVDMKTIIRPLMEEFNYIFPLTFCAIKNKKYSGHISEFLNIERWDGVFGLIDYVVKHSFEHLGKKEQTEKTKMLLKRWKNMSWRIKQLSLQLRHSHNPLAFSFIEGALIKAMKSGDWILLDEINLAEAETLQCLAGLLEGSLSLLEKGERDPVIPHPEFRIFACMNPATDIGKKDLTVGLRNRFTEFYVEEIEDPTELSILVNSYLSTLSLQSTVIQSIVNFYLFMKKEAVNDLNDGTGHRPHYSLRTLCRALSQVSSNRCGGGVFRSLYEGFALSFLSQLDDASCCIVENAIQTYIVGEKRLSILKKEIPEPADRAHTPILGHYIPTGSCKHPLMSNYVLTNSVKSNLRRLARAVSAGKYPILLQGETSVGKTSLIMWLARTTKNKCVRINNHEHTDIQEYVGSYAVDKRGKLVFKEGVLVRAMRKGHWIILDELNLAPSEVLEALNRVLDDNRELFITETQTTIKAHKDFLLFATQNPPGHYGGRKVLSRAFRNRFIELYIGEIPPKDLETILEERTRVAPKHAQKMVAIMQELQVHRRQTGIFAGKQGYITLRDLFRWGHRFACEEEHQSWDQFFANQGYMLLADRVRRPEEAIVIKEVLEKHLKVKINRAELYGINEELNFRHKLDNFSHVVFTSQMKRLFLLVGKALDAQEPVLLVGDTGCGKTTVCQMIAELNGSKLFTVNCHMNSESSDFLGSLRPMRSVTEGDGLFEWVDGPLIEAMQIGGYFLADEISLADDSVLERLNSLLEPERKIQLTENCEEDDTELTAHEQFRFLATMNPSGDYGKKELSPALRNRFTEIWCPSDLIIEELEKIVEHNIDVEIDLPDINNRNPFGYLLSEFLRFYLSTEISKLVAISIRDILTWVVFINSTVSEELDDDGLAVEEAYVHGACLVFLDSLGTSSTSVLAPERIHQIKQESYTCMFDCLAMLKKDLRYLEGEIVSQWDDYKIAIRSSGKGSDFSIGPFNIKRARDSPVEIENDYNFNAPTVKTNTLRIMRAMQLSKPILLEGSPGVGKTSLVTALAKITGYKVVRINLSEQTDITDLFGTDLPVENGECGEFAWRDGPFLQALKNGHWILLDELNLASQSVLEGLNACLDHRKEIYITELDQTFTVSTASRIFGCQNPHRQGGSRKGLPRSFLNRFTQVYMMPLNHDDLQTITASTYPLIDEEVVSKIIEFNEAIDNYINGPDLMPYTSLQFNLRDIFRWCELMMHNQGQDFEPKTYVGLLYADRMRTLEDKKKIMDLSYKIFSSERTKLLQLNTLTNYVQLGYSFLPRVGSSSISGSLLPFQCQLPFLESVMKCIEMNWMPILVGPPASGKTSMVRFLASLTGQTLKVLSMNSEMDTTELLGGFEQANLNRHIDYIIQDLQPLVKEVIFHRLKSEHDQSGMQLTQILSGMYKLNNVQYQESRPTITDELDICNERIQYVEEIFALLDLIPVNEDILSEGFANSFDDLKGRLKNINDKLKITGGVTSGGRFEWVNSSLIQAVQKGHWLLIENVNFCSPSVLDRLNCLLEDNGSLLITEQGTVDDVIPEIQPHPNFRIILTMDPQYGEISPAMRNRGVEIALTRELMDMESFEPWDLLGFFHNFHITDYNLIKTITNIFHCLPRPERIEKPSTYDMCNSVSLIMESLQRNVNVRKAIAIGVTNGFINHIANEESRMSARDIVEDSLRSGSCYSNHLLPYHNYLGQMIISSIDWQLDSVYASAKQERRLLEFILMQLMNTGLGIDQKMCIIPIQCDFPKISEITKWIDVFTLVLRLTYERCSQAQWHIISIWFKETLFTCMSDLKEVDEGAIIIKALQSLVETHFDKFYESVTVEKHTAYMKEKMDKVLPMDDPNELPIDPHELPIDIRTNRHVYDKFRTRYIICKDIDTTFKEVATTFNCSANKILILLRLDSFNVSTCVGLQLEANSGNSDTISLWALSQAVDANPNIPMGKEALLVENLARFITEFYKWMKVTIMERPNKYYTDKNFKLTLCSLDAFFEFARFCADPLSMAMVGRFPWYWSSLKKRMERFLRPTEVENSHITERLCVAIELIQKYVEKREPVAEKTRSKLSKYLNIPLPLVDDSSAILYIDIKTVTEVINIYRIISFSKKCIPDLQVVFTNGSKWADALCCAAVQCISQKVNKDDNAVHDIKLQLVDAGLLEQRNNDDDDDDEIMEVCTAPVRAKQIEMDLLKSMIQFMPLQDYFLIASEVETLASIGKFLNENRTGTSSIEKDATTVEKCEATLFYLSKTETSKLMLDSLHLAGLMSLCSTENNPGVTFSECLVYFFRHLQNGPSARLVPFVKWDGDSQTNADNEGIYAKQLSSVLSSICFNVLSGTETTSNALNLKNVCWKQNQFDDILRLLWQGHKNLSRNRDSFKHNICQIVNSWYESLLISLCKAGDCRIRKSVDRQKILDACQNLELESIFDLDSFPDIMINCHMSMRGLLESLCNEQDNPRSLSSANWEFGKIMAVIGLVSMLLLAPFDFFDPIEKQTIKLSALRTTFSQWTMEWGFYKWQWKSVSGLSAAYGKDSYHPHLNHFVKKIAALGEREQELKRRLGIRSKSPQFKELKNAVNNFFKSTHTPGDIYKQINHLDQLKNKLFTKEVEFHDMLPLLTSLQTLAKNCRIFADDIYSQYSLYRDLILPFLAGAEMLVMGLETLNDYMVSSDIYGYAMCELNVKKFIKGLGSFPYLDENKVLHPLDVANRITEDNTFSCINFIIRDLPTREALVVNVVKSALLEVINETIIFKKNSNILNNLMTLFNHFHKIWKWQEENLKLKKEAAESWYECKTVTYGEEPKSDEAIKQEIKQMFPLYYENFNEFMKSRTVEEDVQPVQQSSNNEEIITPNDMFFIWSCHARVLSGLLPQPESMLSDCNFLVKNIDKSDFLSPYNLRYNVLKTLIQNYYDKCFNYVDSYLIGGHIVAAGTVFQWRTNNPMLDEASAKDYDIYRDPNPAEVVTMSSHLNSLVSRINVILKEFPENPLLTEIKAIVCRIQSFSIHDPLIKFMTGLELVLSSAQTWEQQANKGVSLQTELEAVAQMILRYRKLELSCWNQCLDSVIKKKFVESAKLWFHLYDTVFVNAENADPMSFIEPFKRCMEDASLGEFEPRLLLLQTFFQHMKLESFAPRTKTQNILFNICSYYTQFLPVVQNKIALIRKPIEKDVKEFVKISKWNPADFYLKQASVEKSHKAIHQSMKKFEHELSRLASLEFQVSPKLIEVGDVSWSLCTDIQEYFPSLQTQSYYKDDKPSGVKIFDNLLHYCRKSTKLCKKIFELCPVLSNIKTLNDFTGDIVETMQKLESLEIKKKRDKESQKREIRRVLDHKRKDLANLFKNLALVGLSYRKGQVFMEKFSKTLADKCFLVPTLENKQWIEQLPAKESSNVLSSAWGDSNYYYYKCIAQFFLLEKDSQSPSKDIGDMAIVQKCMGFSGHLLKMVMSQRTVLGSTAEHIQDLNIKADVMMKLSPSIDIQKKLKIYEPSEMCFPPQAIFRRWKDKLSSLLVQTVVAFQQFEIMLDCCPSNSDTFIPETETSALCLLSKGSDIHTKIMAFTQQFILAAKSIISDMLQLAERKVVDTWENLSVLSKCFGNLESLITDLTILENYAVNRDDEVDFIVYIFNLRDEIHCEKEVFDSDVMAINTVTSEPEMSPQEKKLAWFSELLLRKVLKSIENVFTFLKGEAENEKPSVGLEKLVSEQINRSLEKVYELLEVPTILSTTNRIIGCIRHCKTSSQDASIIKKYVINISPVLHRYCEMARLFLVGHIGMHRTSCKFLSELLRIFTDLIVKGFSIPPELEELADKSGATQFKDIEQGGLGEGEGAKDVSDTITSEDQLEEVSGKETEKQKNEKSDIKDEEHGIEMSEDFEGDIYDPDVNDKSADEDEEIDDAEFDKKMGDVGQSEAAENLNDQIWGSDDDEEEEDMEKDDSGRGVTTKEESELAPKDDKSKMDESAQKGDLPMPEAAPEPAMEEEYTGEHVDPSIDQTAHQDPEVLDLDSDLQIDEKETNEDEEMDVDDIKDEKDGSDQEEGMEAEMKDENVIDLEDQSEVQSEDGNKKESEPEHVQDVESELEAEKEADDAAAPTQRTSSDAKSEIIPFEMTKHGSLDMAKPIYDVEDWESSTQEAGDQHQEGEAEAMMSRSIEVGFEGKRSSLKHMTERGDRQERQPAKRRQPRDERTVAEQMHSAVKKAKISDHRGTEGRGVAEEYEHVIEEQDDDVLAIDSATSEQAAKQRAAFKEKDEDYDVIPLLSSSEDEEDDEAPVEPLEFGDDASYRRMGRRLPQGEAECSYEDVEDDDEKYVSTERPQRPTMSVFSTQHDLWSALSNPNLPELREHVVQQLRDWNQGRPTRRDMAEQLWQGLDRIVSPLVQELCEQLRLILEPTKKSKFKGEYRTGKRLNMRKIIPYIASRFQKDKIWLRRTKPSKREYQIMLAVDDSASMADNQSQELALESLVLLGNSLSFLEAGELAVVSFGEEVKVLHDFSDTFSAMAAAQMLRAFSFAQNKTNMVQLLNCATDKMIDIRKSQSNLISSEFAQLLIIISDGRGVSSDRKDPVNHALRRARHHNVFIVFIIVDNPSSNRSILNLQVPKFGPGKVETKSYLETFPFPFYILLQNISSLPSVLGEAMRQWFDLVASAGR